MNDFEEEFSGHFESRCARVYVGFLLEKERLIENQC